MNKILLYTCYDGDHWCLQSPHVLFSFETELGVCKLPSNWFCLSKRELNFGVSEKEYFPKIRDAFEKF